MSSENAILENSSLLNLYLTHYANSANDNLTIHFLFCPREQDSTFHANCLLHLHKMSTRFHHHHHQHLFLINMQLQGQHPHQWAPFQVAGYSLQSLSVCCFHVILGLPGPCFPSTCMSKAVLTSTLERSTCPYLRSLLSFRMMSRSSMASCASSSMDLMVTMSCDLTLQICLIIALSSAADVGGLVLSMAKSHWHGALPCTHKSCTHGHVS